MPNHEAPVIEYPGRAKALIEPADILSKKKPIPQRCVLCYFAEVIEGMVSQGAVPIGKLHGEGEAVKIYRVGKGTYATAICFPGIGAPFAAATLEELIAMGASKFVVCGGAGVLDGSIPAGKTIVPTWALRDEGTSYHYLPPSRTCRPHKKALEAIRKVCKIRKLDYLEGGTWTTDGVYRETRSAVRRRRAEGCLSVEMEAAALFAVARFRKVSLGQILYAGDDVSGPKWNHRRWNHLSETRRNLFDLAMQACKAMED